MSKTKTTSEAAALIENGAIVAVNASSGEHFADCDRVDHGQTARHAAGIKTLSNSLEKRIRATFGTKGIDHIAKPGLVSTILGGSYPSGPSSAELPLIWQMLGREEVAAYNVPSGILFDIMREGAGKRPGVMTKVGLDTFADPELDGCAMNESARRQPIIWKIDFEGEEWLYFPAIAPDVAIIRASTADERGNLTFEHEGAILGAMKLALAAHNNGGTVIAQVKRVAQSGTLKPHDVRVPGILVDAVVEAPDQLQTTATVYGPAISGELFRPLDSFRTGEFNVAKVIARRVVQELRCGWAVNVGLGISANVPRITSRGRAAQRKSPGLSSRVPSARYRCSTSNSGARPTPRLSSHRRTSSVIFRRWGSTRRCGPFCRSTAADRSTCRSCRRDRM